MTDIVVAGNVVEDETPAGWVPGGPSLYAARMAAALVGPSHVTLVTCLPPTYDRSVLEGLTLVAVPAPDCPRYRNRYAPDGERVQHLLARGAPLLLAPDRWPARADVLFLAPALDELDAIPPVDAPLYGVSLQGLLRLPEPGGRVRPIPSPLRAIRPFLRPGGYAFLSVEDTPDAEALACEIAAAGVLTVITRGAGGATVFQDTRRRDVAALHANPVDPTGAGDAFATAFMVSLAEQHDITRATRWGLAAGALATEGQGPLALPGRDALLQRLKEAA